MPEFAYLARTLDGRDVAGTLAASTKREALCALAERSLVALRLEVRRPSIPWLLWRSGRIKPRLLATNLSQLADLLQNGVPLLEALGLLADQAPTRALAEVFRDVRDRVADGMSFDQALARHPKVFGELAVSIVRAGVEGAFLEDALRRTANFLELQEELKSRLVGAMIYPAFLAAVGLVVTTVLIVFFVPRFSGLFARLERSGQGLPLPTTLLLGMSHTISNYGLVILGGVVGAGVALRRLARTRHGRTVVDRWKLRLPVAGKIFHGYAISRFCRVLGTLLHNGVPLLKALDISSQSAGNSVLSEAIRRSAENVSAGNSLSRPLANCGLIPKPIMAMIAIAEQSNSLDRVLVQIAETIDRQNARQLEVMVRLVEPVLLIVMGGAVMFVITALLLPVFDIGAALGG